MEGAPQLLPGLLDDPQCQISDLPNRSNVIIAPLRNPVPVWNHSIPLPLEPKAARDVEAGSSKAKLGDRKLKPATSKQSPPTTPAPVALTSEPRKPITAISELIESSARSSDEPTAAQLPSFVSLSAVEMSYPLDVHSNRDFRLSKRPRLDGDAQDDFIHLPRPHHKNQGLRAPPLIPAIVNGLHEPPPGACLLPSMPLETQTRGDFRTTVRATESNPIENFTAKPPEKMLNSPEMKNAKAIPQSGSKPEAEAVGECTVDLALEVPSKKSSKTRSTPRKFTQQENEDLGRGVEKYGVGKWKAILNDPEFSFRSRSAVDLKDRYRMIAGGSRRRKKRHSQGDEEPLTPPAPNSMNGAIPRDRKIGASEDFDGSLSGDAKAQSTSRYTGFVQSRRRIRRMWTSEEDESLLKGVVKHGLHWTAIHGDPELSLSHRRATDLRDRIRNKFPEGYKNAEAAPLSRKKERKKDISLRLTEDDEPITKATDPRNPGPKTDIPRKLSAAHSGKPNPAENAESAQDHPGWTLPPLVLDDDLGGWGDNTLPPLHEWEEF